MDKQDWEKAFIGCILGTAVGDALGLPWEGMSKQRLKAFRVNTEKYHFLLGKGMVSDDTEHTCMVAESLLLAQDNIEVFRKHFAWRLRFWLLRLPAGVGLGTLRAIVKLWCGFSPHHSGVHSAGNGPAMRIALLGIYWGQTPDKLVEWVKASTHITHRDSKAFLGTLAVAIAACQSAFASEITRQNYFSQLRQFSEISQDKEFMTLLTELETSLVRGDSLETYVTSFGCGKGISGYIYHTVPAVLHCWLRNPENFPVAMHEIISAGGDTDTTAAILGAIIGARVGKNGISEKLQMDLWEWPKNIVWMEQLGRNLSLKKQGQTVKCVRSSIFVTMVRNLLFLVVVLGHGLRRLFPPYSL